jgi:peptidoglycan/LPS O-acetylase OafA/YrhL
VVSGEQMVGAAVVTGALVGVAVAANRMSRWLGGRRVQFLGAVSYSLYLIHAPVIGVVDWARGLVFGESPIAEAVGAVGAIVCSLLAAHVLWWAVERPAIAWSRGLRRRPQPVVVASGSDLVRRRTG